MTNLPATWATLYLVRHGETAHNAAARLQGHLDVPLAARGQAQAAAAGKILRGRDIVAVCSSDLSRAQETATIIAAELGLQVELDGRLREVSVGEWQGLTSPEIRAEYPEVSAQMMADPETTRYPGGESYREMADRVMLALTQIADTHAGQAVVVVTHGGPLRAIMARQLGYDWSQRDQFVFENCGILKLTWADGRPRFSVPAPLLT